MYLTLYLQVLPGLKFFGFFAAEILSVELLSLFKKVSILLS